jgi:hypothetical protein
MSVLQVSKYQRLWSTILKATPERYHGRLLRRLLSRLASCRRVIDLHPSASPAPPLPYTSLSLWSPSHEACHLLLASPNLSRRRIRTSHPTLSYSSRSHSPQQRRHLWYATLPSTADSPLWPGHRHSRSSPSANPPRSVSGVADNTTDTATPLSP